MYSLLFYYFAVATIVTAVLSISRHNPVHSVVFLVPCFFHVAGLFVLLDAEFLAAIQILVYTGAIMVLYLFVVALLDLSETRELRIIHRQRFFAMIAGIALMFELVILTVQGSFSRPVVKLVGRIFGGNTEAVGTSLYTTFLFPFELASLVLLVAIFGVVVLARREKTE
ncbi:MAG: NADH-quinone oxidoreductase subunit J [Deltaproteobacteria bacterium]|nr:NADH-quinone oxidoreductase subunit J [Deltaproteobacteria bacterium]